jgi:hypothetical protein
VAATRGRLSAAAGGSFDALEVSQLAATAEALPDGWIVQVTPPHGQLCILPRRYAHAHHRCLVGDGQLRIVYYADGVRGIRSPAVD